jgi:C4-dicarboxylate-specific signal transduction histidine kinase
MNMTTKQKDNTINFIEVFLEKDYENLKDNLTMLLKDYQRKSKRLDTIIKRSDKQEKQLMSLNEELNDYKERLEQKVQEEIKKREEKEKMLLQQSKLAAMGEMMDAVAHQWKQPINIINMQVDMIGYDYEDNLIDEKYIQEFQSQVSSQIEHMTNTLNEFRSFFRPNKSSSEFKIKQMINKVLLLVKDEFIKNKIEIIVRGNDFSLVGIENEFKHLVLNIINNAKDAFNDNNIQDRKIWIDLIKNDNELRLEITDNAGGIPEHVINDIFKANVTTKAEGKGTGIGLYMSSQIASKHNGNLSVVNTDNGAKFIFATTN